MTRPHPRTFRFHTAVATLALALLACNGPSPGYYTYAPSTPDADTSAPAVITCGDGACAPSEGCDSCPEDCGACVSDCGDGVCAPSEDCGSCATDCGACATSCGDGVCGGGETCATCEADCGPCGTSCGDGTCNSGETCATCPIDCGDCEPTSDTGNCCVVHPSPGCSVPEIEGCVCQSDIFCCQQNWDAVCVATVTGAGCGTCQ